MAKLLWDQTGERRYETGSKMGVLYLQNASGGYPSGVAWNGLTGVSDNPTGGDATKLWADDMKYLTMRSAEEFGFTIRAYQSPDEFDVCDGSVQVLSGVSFGQQNRQAFGFCYRSVIGNDVKLNDYGYKLHLYYGCTASPSSREHTTVNDNPDAIEMSWDCETNPVATTVKDGNGIVLKPVCTIEIDSTAFTESTPRANLDALEAKLYGTDTSGSTEGTIATLPLPDEVYTTLGGTLT